MKKIHNSSRQKKAFREQFDKETVLMLFRHHPVVMRKGLILASIGLLVGPLYTLFLTFRNPENPPTINYFLGSFVVSLIVSAILFFPSWMSWYFSLYIMTNERFIEIQQKGFFSRSMVDIPANQIQMINYEIAGIQETLLGFGTLSLQTFVGSLQIKDVHHPQIVQQELSECLRKLQKDGVPTHVLEAKKNFTTNVPTQIEG
jgi:uncharacterized membrane protein YdbT with pleckstrin-like domain